MNPTHIFFALSALLFSACGGQSIARPAESAPGSENAPASGPVAELDIVETAAEAEQFETLVAAVKAADLESTLRGAGPFTVFAPTDEAFAKLPAGTLESLLRPENKTKLQSILTFHVIAGKVMSTQAGQLTSAKTVQGKELALDASSGSLRVGGANVVKADIEASNGVIHVIDAVLLPE